MKRLYERYVLPKLVNSACSVGSVMQERVNVVPAASGKVLEIGFGSGLNLSSYDRDRVEHVWALEPSLEMLDLARERVARSPVSVELVPAMAEEIPLEDESVDTVVVTFTLCTIPDVGRALEQVRRVLKKNGRMLFCEHGASPDKNVRLWQNRLDPLWTRLAGGCHLNRPIPNLLKENGFEIRSMTADYIQGWKIDSFIYRGEAVPANGRI